MTTLLITPFFRAALLASLATHAPVAFSAACPTASFQLAPRSSAGLTGNSTVAVGDSPMYVVVGRFNGDNFLDIAAVNQGSNDVSIQLGDGDGTFTAAPSLSVTASPSTNGARPSALIAADLDGDLDLDLAVSNRNSGTVDIFKGDNTGAFVLTGNIAVGAAPVSITFGRLNADTHIDLAVSNSAIFGGTKSVAVLLNNGSGVFTHTAGSPFAATNIARPGQILAGQFVGDAALDLAVASGRLTSDPVAIDNLVVFGGVGNGTFALQQTIAAVQDGNARTTRGAIADVNNDGRTDIVIGNLVQRADASVPPSPFNAAAVFLGSASGLSAPSFHAANADVSAAMAADINRDDRPDVIVSNAAFAFGASVLMQNMAGPFGFGAPGFYAAAGNPFHVASGDFDLSGAPDFVVVNQPSNTLSVYLNQCTGNAAPVANNDGGAGFITDEDNAIVLPSLVANDFDPDNNTMLVQSIDTSNLLGQAILSNSVVTYNPSAAFETLENGDSLIERFTYVVNDGLGGTASATVSLVINGVTDPRDLAISFNEAATPAVNVAGTSLPFSLNIANLGVQQASGGTISGTLPAYLSFPNSGPCVQTGSSFSCAFGPVSAGQSINVAGVVNVAADAPASGNFSVTMSSNQPDPVNGNNADELQWAIARSTDVSALLLQGADGAGTGVTVTYRVRVSSSGPSSSAARVQTTATGLTAISWTCTPSGAATCAALGSGDIGADVSFVPGSSLEYSISGTVAVGEPVFGLRATVAAANGTSDPNASNNEVVDFDAVLGDSLFVNGFEQ